MPKRNISVRKRFELYEKRGLLRFVFPSELSKNRVKISTLLVDSPRSRTELMESFEDALSPGVPEEFVVNPFLFLQPVSEMEEDDGFYDLALMVEGYVFYCNKVTASPAFQS